MTKDYYEKVLVSCTCHDPEHDLRFSLTQYEWAIGDIETDLYVHVFMHEYGFFNRLWKGIKYIFGYKCKYGHFMEFVLRDDDVSEIQKMLKVLNKYHELRKKDVIITG